MANQNKTSQKVTSLQEKDSGTFRNPPANYDAERALLGSILIDNLSLDRVSFLMPEHFADPNHGEIFQVLLTVIQKSGQIADPLTLKNYFESKDRLESIGGAAYIAKLAEEAVLTSSAGEYGRIIYDLYKRRMLVSLGHDIMNRSYDNNLEESASNLIEKAEQNLYELATSDDYDGDLRSFDKSLTSAIKIAETAYKKDGKLTGVSTALLDLDKQLGGLHPSDLVIIAGRPSMGKTALALSMARNSAVEFKHSVGIFSLEMSNQQLAERLITSEARVDSHLVRTGRLPKSEWKNLATAAGTLSEAPISVSYTHLTLPTNREV